MTPFAGFPEATRQFLLDLRANNTKAWFDAHRSRYQEAYLAPAVALVEALGPRLTKLAPGIRAEPKVNGSIFRINRDIRFAADKTPYKDHVDLWFWEGERKGAVSGFFIRLTPESIGMGVGCHGFAKEKLPVFRAKVDDKKLAAAVNAIEKVGYEVAGMRYAKLPPSVKAGTSLGERLGRHDALYTHTEAPATLALDGPQLLETALGHFKRMAPLHRWLVDEIQ